MGTRFRAMRGGSGEQPGPQETGFNGSGRVGRRKFLSSDVRTSIRSVFCHMRAWLSTSNYNLVCPMTYPTIRSRDLSFLSLIL